MRCHAAVLYQRRQSCVSRSWSYRLRCCCWLWLPGGRWTGGLNGIGLPILPAVRVGVMVAAQLGAGMMRSWLIVLAVMGATSAAFAEPLVGSASVIDGDTIEIHGQRIRLNGVDAPESKQLCLDAKGGKYRCGQKAALALADFLDAHRPTSCIGVDRDRYKRVVAVCTAGGIDIAEWMVSQGHALEWPRYSAGAYAHAQKAARAVRRGMWSGSFARPWEWRQQREAAPLVSVDSGS